ncbi:MAG: OsmC family protein [Candidatus Helarchaeota archaeon]
MPEELRTKVSIVLEKEMLFKCDIGEMKVEECYIDETEQEEAERLGPDPAKLLGLSVLGCMAASFLFCIEKRKLVLEDFKGEAEVVVIKNEKDLYRVKEINVKLQPNTSDPALVKRIGQCKNLFESHCTITESIRKGIKVNVDLDL